METNLLQRKANLWHPAFIPGGVINGDVSEETEIDESVRILHVPDEVLERPAAAADEQLITEYVDSEKWCGDERTKYAVLKVEATSFVLWCYLRGACPRACELNRGHNDIAARTYHSRST
jgi:hypothetical protein